MNVSSQLAVKFRSKPDMTQDSQYPFLFFSIFVISFSPPSIQLPAVAVYGTLVLNACGVLVLFLSAEVKKHDMPLGHNYPMPATITVVSLQSFPEGRGHGAHTASPYPPE